MWRTSRGWHRRLGCGVVAGMWALASLLVVWQPVVSAITPQQRLDYTNQGISFIDDPCSTSAGGGSSAPGSQSPGIWKSGLTPPYSLEDYVVEVLKDIAQKEGVSADNTVTEEHVIALVAFAWGEGGNLTNNDIYNVWNTGYSASDLQPVGGHSTSGVQSYGSFDEGVEASARVMTGGYGSGGYQSRLGRVLADKNSTAVDFMKALTYYQNYKGNLEWAEASMPPNQETYYGERLTLINQTRKNYVDYASTTVGPPGQNYFKKLHVPASKLKFIPQGASATGTTGATVVNQACGSQGAAGVAGYKNPLRAIKGLKQYRIDEGVDYGGTGPVYAIGTGVVKKVVTDGSGWPGLGTARAGAYINYQLTQGSAAGKYIYFSEDCRPKVHAGDPVTADTVICEMCECGTNIETGWSKDETHGTEAMAYDIYHPDGLVTQFGKNFSLFMVALGAPPGVVTQGLDFDKSKLPAGWPTAW